MTKYFSFSTITGAVENLKLADGKWLLIPLVLAANRVSSSAPVECGKLLGTGKYLNHFFDGQLIGLEPKEPGGRCNIRPLFSDLRKGASDARLVHVDYSDLWGRTFSQSGYPAMRDNDTLMKTSGSHFQLGPNFGYNFRAKIPTAFKFESLLVWLYAFSGIDDAINSWQDLLDYFTQNFTYQGQGIPTEYLPVFSLSPGEPWPTDFVQSHPSTQEFQDFLLPGIRACHIGPDDYSQLRQVLSEKFRDDFLEYTDSEISELATSIISSLQSCRRLFLYGEPGTGKSELARLIVTSFEEVLGDRTHSVFMPVADSTTADKLFGFSTLDGRWIDGILTQENVETKRRLLYEMRPEQQPDGTNQLVLTQFARRQINILILDEANRRDIEELLVKVQASLDAESGSPEHVAFKISLDNAGERNISPNTFLVMTGNSPRDDSGRVVQSRPFKRRHNLIVVPNVFERVLDRDNVAFAQNLLDLWNKVGPVLSVTDQHRVDFATALTGTPLLIGPLRLILRVLQNYCVGVSYGLVQKLLKTSGARFAHTADLQASLDYGLTESVFPLLSSEMVVNGSSIRDALMDVDPMSKAPFPVFFRTVENVLRSPDTFGRVRPFV